MKRWEFERAVVASDLPAPARHVLHVLGIVANWPGGVVPAEYTKSLTELARMTGLGRSTVARALKGLEHRPEHAPSREGWVARLRPPVHRARAEKEKTQYRLRVPTGSSPRAGLVPERDQSSSPRAGLPSPGAGPELVPERDGASPRAGHKPERFQNYQPAGAQQIVIDATGATAEEAEAVARRVQNERQPRSLPGLLRRMAADGDLAQLVGEHRAAAKRASVAQALEEARRGPECEHRVPGGAALHPTTREPICVQCRMAAKRNGLKVVPA